MPVFDSMARSYVQFPQQAVTDETASRANQSMAQLRGTQSLKKNNKVFNQKKSYQDAMLIQQIETDLMVLQADLEQQAMTTESQPLPVDAKEQQEKDEELFHQTLDNVEQVGKCFWRFDQVTTVLKSLRETLKRIIERKNRQIELFQEQVKGQFDIINDRIQAQRTIFERVELHLKSEMAFREKVLDRERNQVMRLIEEWEN